MGTCAICGQKAGLFSNFHQQCASARDSALASIRQGVRDALVGEQSVLLDLSCDEEFRAPIPPKDGVVFYFIMDTGGEWKPKPILAGSFQE